MPVFKDQTGYEISVDQTPKRIISLVPSQSEFLWDLGLEKELVGITKFCIHPEKMFRAVERVGGTKKPDLEKIRGLKPDLIIGNKEENEKSDIEALRKEFPVWMSDIIHLSNAYTMMESVGELVGRKDQAAAMVDNIKQSLNGVRNLFGEKRVAYFIWKKPYMFAANNTFINSILEYTGLKNVCSGLERYPEITLEQLKSLAPDFIFLSSEPYPFKEKDAAEIWNTIPNAKVLIVDGEMFSWYGSRLLKAAGYLEELRRQIGE